MLRSVPSWVPAVDVFEGNVGLSSPADVANPWAERYSKRTKLIGLLHLIVYTYIILYPA